MRRDIAGKAEINRMAERQHAALAEQHVEGKREDGGNADLAHHRNSET